MEIKSSAEVEVVLKQHQDDQQKQHFHVLAVDDSILDRKLLERLLTFSSYQVTCVDSGDKALEYLGLMDNNKLDNTSTHSTQEGLKVNMIMTDYCMPGMTGYDLLKKVKDSSWKDVPVVVMSSENIPSRISKCLEEGAEEFLLKPVRLSDVEKLQSHLLKTHDHQKMDKNINKKRKPISDPEPPQIRPNNKIKGLALV